MPGLRNLLETRGQRLRLSSQGNQIERRADGLKRRDQLRHIATNAGGG
jgi:hypothetical protein